MWRVILKYSKERARISNFNLKRPWVHVPPSLLLLPQPHILHIVDLQASSIMCPPFPLNLLLSFCLFYTDFPSFSAKSPILRVPVLQAYCYWIEGFAWIILDVKRCNTLLSICHFLYDWRKQGALCGFFYTSFKSMTVGSPGEHVNLFTPATLWRSAVVFLGTSQHRSTI